MLHGGGGEVCSNDRGPFDSDDLTAHHVWSVKARQLDTPYFRLVLDNHAHSSMCVAIRRCDHLQAHHVVYHTVTTIILVVDLGIRHNY